MNEDYGVWLGYGDQGGGVRKDRSVGHPRFAVDFDGTLIEDDNYPAIGPWIDGAVNAIKALDRIGEVVIYTCRAAPAEQHTERPRSQDEVDQDIAAIKAKLDEVGLGHLEVWTKPYKPPAEAYIDNKGVAFRGFWDQTLEDVLDLVAPVRSASAEKCECGESWCPCRAEETALDDMSSIHTFSKKELEEMPRMVFEGLQRLKGQASVFTAPRHPNSQRFHDLLDEAGELHDIKQADYGKGDDPFANVRASADWGMPAWVGAMVRATDKVRRLQTFASKGELQNESVIDAFMDLAVYALIARVLYEEGS